MKITTLKMIMYLSFISTSLKTPMSMMITLLLQTMLSIVIMNKMFNSSWYPMIMFLMMIGGLLIIFMYMSSISSNEKFKTNFIMIMPILIMFMMYEEFLLEVQMNENESLIKLQSDMMILAKMYNKTFLMMMLMALYLLFSMICINKIIKFYEGPLRSKTYE